VGFFIHYYFMHEMIAYFPSLHVSSIAFLDVVVLSPFLLSVSSQHPLLSCITLIVTSLRLTAHLRLTNPILYFPIHGGLVFMTVIVAMLTCTLDSLLPNCYFTEMHDSSMTRIAISLLDVVSLTPCFLSISS
jgi:hypothetical protein